MITRRLAYTVAPFLFATILVAMLMAVPALFLPNGPSLLQAAQNFSPPRAINAVDVAALLLDKTVGVDANVCATATAITVTAGTSVTYCYEITNTGTVTLTQHDLVDSELGNLLTNFPYSLTPGASAFLTQTTIITQTTVNSAIWTAYNVGPTDVTSSTDSATVTVLPPSILLSKTVGVDADVCASEEEIMVAAGTSVTYCYEITNTGTVTLTQHDLVDSELGNLLTNFPYNLIPGANAFLTETTVITQTTVNSAIWTAYNAGPTDVISATDSATVTVLSPSILLSKTVGVDADICASEAEIMVVAGTSVTYCYEITNTGTVTLTQHDLVDSELGNLLTNFPYNLVPGASVFVTETAEITQTTVNSATWIAYNVGPTDVISSTDSATVNIMMPSITVIKSANTSQAEVGDVITYTYLITNSGNVTFTTITAIDSPLGTVAGLSGLLFPGDDRTATLTHTVLASDPRPLVNTVIVTGTVNASISATDTAVVTVVIDDPTNLPPTESYLPRVEQ